MKINDKVIIITGASQGIGLGAAKLLASKGAKVVLAARSEELLKKAENEIPNSYSVVTDVTKEEDAKNLIDKTLEKFGRIDILINNAGQGIHGFSVESTNLEDYRKVMELNVFSVVRLMQLVIPVMRKQGRGMIINISSMLSKMYIPYLAQYSSTKHALNAISLTARQELAKDNIIVSLVLPKMTATNFMKNSINTSWKPSKDDSDEERQMPEIDRPEKVADRIAEVINSEKAEIDL